jgi:hypothetical protein
MAVLAPPEKTNSRHRGDSVAVCITLERAAYEILKRHCPPGKKVTGRLVGRLLFEFQARQAERERVVSLIAGEKSM